MMITAAPITAGIPIGAEKIGMTQISPMPPPQRCAPPGRREQLDSATPTVISHSNATSTTRPFSKRRSNRPMLASN